LTFLNGIETVGTKFKTQENLLLQVAGAFVLSATPRTIAAGNLSKTSGFPRVILWPNSYPETGHNPAALKMETKFDANNS
jgi:hypothetical protein